MYAIWRRIGEFITVLLPADDEVRFHDPAQLKVILLEPVTSTSR